MTKKEKNDTGKEEIESEYSEKSHDIASVLCLFGAPIGLHKLYLGHYISAFIMFILFISATFYKIIGIGGVVICYSILYIWVVIEIYRAYYGIFFDRKGKLLSQDPNPSDCITIFKALVIAIAVFGVASFFNPIYLINVAFTSIFLIIYGIKSILYMKRSIDYLDIQIQEQKQKKDDNTFK